MDRTPKAPRVYTGYGSGAATPEPTPAPKPQRTWEPTVTRGRTTTSIPQQDMPEAAPRPRVPVASRPQPKPVVAAPRVQAPTPDMDPVAQRRVTGAARAVTSGVGGFYDRAMGGTDSAMERLAGKVPTKPLKYIFKQNASSYRGALGKLMLIGDAQAFVESVQEVANPDRTAEIIYNARPQDFASIDDVKQEVQAYNAGEGLGIIAENAAQGLILTAGIFAGLTGAWAIAAPMLAMIGVMSVLKAVAGPEAQEASAQNVLLQNPYALKEVAENTTEPGPLETVAGTFYQTHGGPIAGMIGMFTRDRIVENFRDNFNAKPKQNSYEEVQRMRQDRGILGTIDGSYAGFETKFNLYKSFGDREQEVGLALTMGYFMKPTGVTYEVPDGNGGYMEIRDFDLDYPAFVTWFEDTDWLEQRTGLVQRVAKLPGISGATIAAQNQSPITPLEARYALKFWYDYYNEQQAAP